MGNKIEVWCYVKQDGGGYDYEQEYGGRSLPRALLAAARAKRRGVGCVKLEWR